MSGTMSGTCTGPLAGLDLDRRTSALRSAQRLVSNAGLGVTGGGRQVSYLSSPRLDRESIEDRYVRAPVFCRCTLAATATA